MNKKMPAGNGRFCEMAVVALRKVTCEHERKYPFFFSQLYFSY